VAVDDLTAIAEGLRDVRRDLNALNSRVPACQCPHPRGEAAGHLQRLPASHPSVSGRTREDNFDLDRLPTNDHTIMGDINAHHPLWDSDCDEADGVGRRVMTWLDRTGWTVLNSGEPTFVSYRTGSRTAPDVAACSPSLARKSM